MPVEFPPVVMIPIEEIKPNEWNPNVMAAQDFNDLVENIEALGFVEPIVVVQADEGEGYNYKIVGGEHRFEGLRLLDAEEIPCVVVDKLKGDAYQQKLQTVRLNKIRGVTNKEKFRDLVNDLLTQKSFDEVAEDLLFHDPSELQELMDSARDALPSEEMREAFDQARDEIKTVDDLSLVLNRLFTQFGSSLPYNFMVLDFGGREHIWVRLKTAEYKKARSCARECMAHGITFDSVMARVMLLMDVAKFVDKHKDFLEEVPAEAASEGDVRSIEDLTEEIEVGKTA